jgi:RNA polymerase sigma factor (sigma-70 family)
MATTANRRIPLPLLHALAEHRLSDGELLRRYLAVGDEAAFAEIVRHNGPLVLRACRHVLGETTAAEDAFQATFLLLACKGRSLPAAGSLAGWLHAAAVRIAGDARRADWRRRRRESAAGERARASSPSEELLWREVRERLDAELAALPEKYRLPLVLCYLQELSYEEAAHRAGCSTGAFRGRLERGKKLLRARLARYGLPLAAPILVLGRPAAVSAALAQTTLATASAGLSGGAVPAAVAALAGPAISLTARRTSLAVVLIAVFGFAWASQGGPSPEPKPRDLPQSPAETQPAAPQGKGMDARGDPLPPGAVARFGTRRFQVADRWPAPVSALEGKAFLVYLPGVGERGRADLRWVDAATGKLLDAWPVPVGPVYDAETGKPTRAVPDEGLKLVALSRDGRWAVFTDPRSYFSGIRVRREKPDQSFRLYVYDLTAKKKVKDLRGHLDETEYHPESAWVSADGKWLASRGGKVRLWDVTTGQQVWANEDAGQGFSILGFTPGNQHLVLCGDDDGAIVVVDTAEARIVRTIATNHGDRRRGAILSPDGATVLMGLVKPFEVAVWDVNAGKPLPPLDEKNRKFEFWNFSPDGKTFVSAVRSDTTHVVVRDWPARTVRRRIDLGRNGVTGLFVSAENRTVNVSFEWEQTLYRYDLESGKPLPVPGETHRGRVVGVEVAPDGSVLSLGVDRVLRTWDLASGRQMRQVPLDFTPAETPFALSRDGKLLAVADYYMSEVVIFDRDGKVVRRIDAAKQRIDHVVFSPSSRFLAGSGHDAKSARVWETATGKTVAEFAAAKGVWWSRTVDFAFSPDERYFVATAEGRLQFWEVNGWRPAEGLSEHVSGMAFSPDGRMLACGDARETAVWELATRKLRLKVGDREHWNRSQRFSPDGRLLALLTSADAVEVWDVFRGQRVAVFQGHDSPVKAFAFTNDGRHLITASEDCTLLAWDLAGVVAAARAGQKVLAPTEQDVAGSWNDLSSPDAAKAFTAIRVLTDAPERAIDLARTVLKAPAPLDAEKVQRFLADLGSDTFVVRRRATQELEAMGEMVELPVRQFLAGNPPLETRRRAELILGTVTRLATSPERLRQRRAVEVLEQIDGEKAREILRPLTKGPPESPLTRDATATLRRMETRR